jgi:ATP-dependent protease HslVU (ClpYQ) peptidase subunit
MTTIATDGKTMAADGLITENDRVCLLDHVKVRRLKDGRLVGFCGNAYNWDSFAGWLEDGGDVPKVEEGFGCLILSTDGSVSSYDQHGRQFPEMPPVAIGSGGALAQGAMDAGKSAAEAVSIACYRDIFSGGVVTVLEIEQPALALVAGAAA